MPRYLVKTVPDEKKVRERVPCDPKVDPLCFKYIHDANSTPVNNALTVIATLAEKNRMTTLKGVGWYSMEQVVLISSF